MTGMMNAFYLCLLSSIVWAPIVFIIAARIRPERKPKLASIVWPGALLLAALPAFAAPVAASLGLSLRAPAPAPIAQPVPRAAVELAPAALEPMAAPQPTLSLSAVVDAVASLYFYGFLLFALLTAARFAAFAWRVRRAEPLGAGELRNTLEDWRARMGLRHRVRFAVTDAVSSVCVHGFTRPVVLTPPDLLQKISMEDAALMGAHEMAHIKRGDTVLFAFCGLVGAVFWFNPFMRRIVKRAMLAAEQSADALVIAAGVNRRRYARCFVEGLRFSAGLKPRDAALVPSFTPFDKRSRRERLDAILSGAPAPTLSLKAKLGLGAGAAAAGALALAQAALAVAPPAAKDALPQPPVTGRITASFDEAFADLPEGRLRHEGVDIAAPTGTPVRAAGAGRVMDATANYQGTDAWGNVVVIDHGGGLVTRYAHLERYDVVAGDRVLAGDVIGAVGSTGRSKGPHLHFEVLQDGVHMDPHPVVAAAGAPPAAPKPVREGALRPAPAAPEPLGVASAAPQAPRPEALQEPVAEPAPAPKPEPAPEPSDPFADLGAAIAGKIGNLELEDMLEDMRFEFNGEVYEGSEGALALADQLGDFQLHFGEIGDFAVALPDTVIAMADTQLTEEQREAIKEAAREARLAAREAVEEAREEMRRAREEQRRAQAEIERETRALQRKWRREWGRDARRGANEDQAELLRLREEALAEAERSLNAEREELRRLREELEAEHEADDRG